MEEVRRLTLFAGPNGSGKSTLVEEQRPEWIGHYLNADELEKALAGPGYDLVSFPAAVTQDDINTFWATTPILPNAERCNRPELRNQALFLASPKMSYGAAAMADFLRKKLLSVSATFSFESVMSHESKVDLLREANEQGYETFLFFVATDDVRINISRVKARVKLKGHPVSEDKIRSRYSRTLELLPSAIQAAGVSQIFDNSAENATRVWLATVIGGSEITLNVDEDKLPSWFIRHVLNNLEPQA